MSVTQWLPMPVGCKRPVARYYQPICWPLLKDWSPVRFDTPADGSCFFHSVANSFFAAYHQEQLYGKPFTRTAIIKAFRNELADQLAADNRYQQLSGGNLAAFSEVAPEFRLEAMQQQLRQTQEHIGHGFLQLVTDILDKDIYILAAARQDLYATDELPFILKGNRLSIVLYYDNSHYELVGLNNGDGTFITHFTPTHPFIQHLYRRAQSLPIFQR